MILTERRREKTKEWPFCFYGINGHCTKVFESLCRIIANTGVLNSFFVFFRLFSVPKKIGNSVHTTTRDHKLAHRLHTKVFNGLYNRSLLYNTCWEDPALDRVALDLTDKDEVLVITSAGCNALDYCLDAPKQVHAVDANPRQNALLDLKCAGIKALEYEDFYKIFGEGYHPDAPKLYTGELRAHLPEASRAVWDKNIRWFNNKNCSFYYRGLSGTLARGVRWFMRMQAKLWRGILNLLNVKGDIEEQRRVFDEQVEPYLINRSLGWILDRQFTMSLVGVPYEQREAVRRDNEDGVAGFVRECLSYVCRELPFWQNYFYRVYLQGSYQADCCRII